MYISLEWVSEYVQLPEDFDPSALAHELTLRTVEVEGTKHLADRFADEVVIGRVVSVEQDGDRYGVCVDIGRKIQVQSEIPVEEESFVAVGHEPSGAPYLTTPCRLGLTPMYDQSTAAVPIDLSEVADGVALGSDAIALLGWDDILIEIDNKSLTNRPDLWGHYGIAREIASIYGAELLGLPHRELDPKKKSTSLIDHVEPSTCNRMTLMEIESPDGAGRIAPLAIRSRLARIGQRTLGLYADLTNYVMFAVGQPSHAYDASKVSLPFSVVSGVTAPAAAFLSGEDHEITETMPVIVDASGPIAIAGVVGDAKTQVTADSTSVVLEMANFDRTAVRRSTFATRSRTDASSRFEKGLDTQSVDRGRGYLAHLIAQHDPSSTITSHQDEMLAPTVPTEVETSLSFLNSRMGTELSPDEVAAYLRPLGFETKVAGEDLTVKAPSWRSTGDVSIPNDILEEVSRMIGYDNLVAVKPAIELRAAPPSQHGDLERRLREYLAFRAGAQEILTYPWATDRLLAFAGWADADLLAIDGSVAPDQAHLRPSLLPNLIGAAETGLTHYPNFVLFELGSVYRPRGQGRSSQGQEQLPDLKSSLGVVFVGDDLGTLFRRAVGAVTDLPKVCRMAALEIAPTDGVPWGDPTAALRISASGDTVGHIGAINLAEALDTPSIQQVAVGIELELGELELLPSRSNTYHPVSPFPGSSIDLSVILPDKTSWAELAGQIEAASLENLSRLEFVEEYRDARLGVGVRSITLRAHLVSDERTLEASDKAAMREQLVELLESQFGAAARG